MTNAGEIDRRVVIERNTPATSALNEPVDSWAALATRWARRRDVSDGERAAAGAIGSYLISRFVIRSDSVTRTITPEDRLNYAGGLWNITAVKETEDGRLRFLEITATRDADA